MSGGRCVDVGASTGGFTQALLQSGAVQVLAIDVGTGQLAPAIAHDPRVSEKSETHVLSLSDSDVGKAEVIVMDVSFISAATVVRHVSTWCAPGGALVVLVKPQFEVGREALGRGGIVRSVNARRSAVHRVLEAAYHSGLGLRDAMMSPIQGSAGNIEYLLWLSPHTPGMMDEPAARALADSLEQEGR